MVISSEGYFYSYNIDLENGGECSLMKQYRFVGGYIVNNLMLMRIFTAYWILGRNPQV
jgi:hypothetical protein